MNSRSTHIKLAIYLLLGTTLFSPSVGAFHVSAAVQDDSVWVEELLLKDTLGLQISGPSSDVKFYMNGMIFLSNTKYHQKMIPDHIAFGVVKAYFVPLEYVALESSRPLFVNDDFPYSPAGMSFTRDYSTVYFTKPVGLYGKRNVEKIFQTSIVNGETTEHNQLAFTGDPSRYMHPAISLDDSYMIFSSDRTPSSGGLDLFISRKTPSGWSTPVNMGDNINSSGHEWYPYLDHRNNLYFSSSGHMGYGGYDVYVCFFDGTGWGNPQNMTGYVNSSADELGFSLHPNKKMALFSRVIDTESSGEIFKMTLNDKALLLSGIEDPGNQDIAGLFQDMLGTGYTSGALAASPEEMEKARMDVSALPLLSETKAPEPEQAKIVETTPVLQTEPEPVQQVVEPEPILEVAVAEPVVETPEPEPAPDRVVFRVQILSNSKAKSSPSVTIAGTRYSTFEYYYKGAYRITVGEFSTVQEASAFRTKCKSSGYDQAFVAAFRGSERVTDPAVFRQ